MKKIILLFFILIGHIAYNQEALVGKPNFDTIEKNIENKNSRFYYSDLMNRFMEADSNLSIEEKRHLYYGYVFQEGFSFAYPSKYHDSIGILLQTGTCENLDFESMSELSNKILEENPADFLAYDYQLTSSEFSGDKKTHDKRLIQRQVLIDAILSSGSGENIEDPIYVIGLNDAFYLVHFLGFEIEGSDSSVGNTDFLKFRENDEGREGFYFKRYTDDLD